MKIYNGSEGIQLKAAPLKVDQDIALTLPEYAVCSLPWGILESPTPPLIRLFTGLDLSCGPRSHGENGLVTQKRLGVVLPLRLISYN